MWPKLQIQLRTHADNCFYYTACIARNEMLHPRNRILCPAMDGERGNEAKGMLSRFENYSITVVSSLHTQAKKKPLALFDGRRSKSTEIISGISSHHPTF